MNREMWRNLAKGHNIAWIAKKIYILTSIFQF